MTKKEIFVTKPFLPPLKEVTPYLEKIWNSKILTNSGDFHKRFEKELADYLGVKYVSLFCNGTLALITALQALKITGEVITSPFSFPATTHSLWWNNIRPVFADIEPDTFNLDPEKIESAITPRTTAILPIHVFGNPCDVDAVKKVADKYGLKVIYDACHAFGVKIKNKSILHYGDLSVLSFHATKVFTTFEGGAIVSHDKSTKRRIDYLKNFGFADETTIVIPGINAKMSEFNAALGLVQLKYNEKALRKRKKITEFYRKKLKGIKGIRLLQDIKGVKHAYPYFPVLIDESEYGKSRDFVYEELKKHKIFSRRYFYPLISQFPAYKELESARPGKMPVAEKITEQVLCLPMYTDLESDRINDITDILKNML